MFLGSRLPASVEFINKASMCEKFLRQIFRPDFLKFRLHFLRKCNLNFLISDVDSESLSTLRNINFKREASRVEGYVTPSCTEMRLSVRNLRKLRKFENYLRKF